MDEARGVVVRPERPTPGRIAGERKPVTALFVDIVGSTALAESMDPEEWAELVNGAFHVLSEPVARYEGTVAQLQGDAMLAFFGAPVTHEDDPERAVRAALEMVAGMETYGRETAGASHGVPLEVRVGLNTGPVIVGHVGSDHRLEYTAIGDTMNVAARMQASAEPGTIRITEATERLVAHAFELRDLGSVEVKGKAEPVHAFQVLAARADRVSPRGLPGMTSPLVGRAAELETLRNAFAAIGPGSGAAAIVVGEPGIGKSRLLREFRELVPGEQARWVEAQALSHGRTLPFHLVAGLVRDLAGIRDGDPVAAARRKLEDLAGTRAGGASDPPGEGSIADHLAHLLSVPVDEAVVRGLERIGADELRQRYADAIGTVLGRSATGSALVVVAEDVHWADQSSIATLSRTLPALASARILLVVTSRPDPDSAGWPLLATTRETYAERAHAVTLSPLSDTDSRALVANLLEIESLSETVRSRILTRSEGNPFFVEEIIRMLIGRRMVVRRDHRWVAGEGIEAVEIPPTIHGLLLARMDALPDGARRALRAASVIGRAFGRRILAEVVGALDGSLGALETAGLVAPAAEDGERFEFRHALIQETAYDSILRRDRADLHRAVAEAIQHAEPDRLDDRAAELAIHYDAAGDAGNAAEWAFRAGRHAERRGAMPEARALYDLAASWLPDDPAHRRRRVEIALGQGRSGLYFKALDEELERLGQQAATWAEELGDPRLLVEVYASLAFALQIRGDQYETSETLRHSVDRALELGATLGDDPIRGRPLLARGGARLMAGEYETAVKDLAAAVPLLEDGGDLLWAFEAQNNLAWGLSRLGRLPEMDAAIQHAVDLAQRSRSPTAQIDVKSTIAIARQETEEFDEALRLAREAAVEGEEKRILTCAAFGHLTSGEILLRRGETADAERALKRATRLARAMHAAFIENLGSAGLNAARWAAGRREEALAGWAEALERSLTSGDPYAAADIRWRRGTALAGDEATRGDGVVDLEAAATGFGALGARPARARVLHDLAEALAAAGRTEEAARTAADADELRRELGLKVAGTPA